MSKVVVLKGTGGCMKSTAIKKLIADNIPNVYCIDTEWLDPFKLNDYGRLVSVLMISRVIKEKVAEGKTVVVHRDILDNFFNWRESGGAVQRDFEGVDRDVWINEFFSFDAEIICIAGEVLDRNFIEKVINEKEGRKSIFGSVDDYLQKQERYMRFIKVCYDNYKNSDKVSHSVNTITFNEGDDPDDYFNMFYKSILFYINK